MASWEVIQEIIEEIMMNKKLWPLLILSLWAVGVVSLIYVNRPVRLVYAQVQSSDPCQSTAVPKSSIPINISATASTTQLIAAGVSTNSQIFVCGLSVTISGTTTPSFQLIAGTGATCGTNTVTLTGGWIGGATSAPTPILTGVITLVTTPAATNLCAVAGGTAPTVQGVLTFLKQPL